MRRANEGTSVKAPRFRTRMFGRSSFTPCAFPLLCLAMGQATKPQKRSERQSRFIESRPDDGAARLLSETNVDVLSRCRGLEVSGFQLDMSNHTIASNHKIVASAVHLGTKELGVGDVTQPEMT